MFVRMSFSKRLKLNFGFTFKMMATSNPQSYPPPDVAHAHLSALFDERATVLNEIRDKIASLLSSDSSTFSIQSDKVKECISEISTALKESYIKVVGVLKGLDKEYTQSSSFSLGQYLQDSYPKVSLGFENSLIGFTEPLNNDNILMKLVIIHFYRSGLFNVAEVLEQVSYYPIMLGIKRYY